MSRRANLAAFIPLAIVFIILAVSSEGRGHVFPLLMLVAISWTFVVQWRRAGEPK